MSNNKITAALDAILYADLPDSTLRVAVHLLNLCDPASGHTVLTWDELLAVAHSANKSAARRHLTRMQQAALIHYSTNEHVYITFHAFHPLNPDRHAYPVSPDQLALDITPPNPSYHTTPPDPQRRHTRRRARSARGRADICAWATPDQRVDAPNLRVGAPDQRVDAPDQRVDAPDQRAHEPAQTPNPHPDAPDRRVNAPNRRVGAPDRRVGAQSGGTIGGKDWQEGWIHQFKQIKLHPSLLPSDYGQRTAEETEVSLQLLTDPDIAISSDLARHIAAIILPPEIFDQALRYIAERYAGQLHSVGALIHRLAHQHDFPPQTALSPDRRGTDYYLRHHDKIPGYSW